MQLKRFYSIHMALVLITVENPNRLTHRDICDALGHIYCATFKVSHSVSVWQRFYVEYNTTFKKFTQIDDNATSSTRQLMKS